MKMRMYTIFKRINKNILEKMSFFNENLYLQKKKRSINVEYYPNMGYANLVR
jgi:hypothetical protein